MLYYQKCNCQPLIISNWNNGKFSSYLEVENFQACFCLCPPPFLLSPRAKKIFRARFARAKNYFLSPQSSGSRTGGYLLSCPTLCKHWRLDFLSQPPFFSNFSIPAALAAHRYSWPPMTISISKKKEKKLCMSTENRMIGWWREHFFLPSYECMSSGGFKKGSHCDI